MRRAAHARISSCVQRAATRTAHSMSCMHSQLYLSDICLIEFAARPCQARLDGRICADTKYCMHTLFRNDHCYVCVCHAGMHVCSSSARRARTAILAGPAVSSLRPPTKAGGFVQRAPRGGLQDHTISKLCVRVEESTSSPTHLN